MPHVKKRKLKPKVGEISLAFDPMNEEKFIMRKDNGNVDLTVFVDRINYLLNHDKGGTILMDKLIELLKDEKLLKDEEAFTKALDVIVKDENLNEDTVKAIMATRAVLVSAKKDQLPKDFIENLTKAIKPEGVDVEKIKEGLRKDIKTEVEKEFKEKLEELNKNSGNKDAKMEALIKENVDMKKKMDVLTSDLQAEKDARRTKELNDIIKENHIPGDAKEIVKTLITLEKESPDAAKSVLKTYIETGKKISTLFDESGSSGDGDELVEAKEKLERLVKDAKEKDKDLTDLEARKLVGKENPKLYRAATKVGRI